MSFEEFIATVSKEHFYEGRSHKEYEILSVSEQTIVVKDVSKDKVLKIPADKLYEGFDTLGVEKCSSDRLKTYIRRTLQEGEGLPIGDVYKEIFGKKLDNNNNR